MASGATAQALMVYVTAASLDEARSLGRMLVEKRIAACVNIFPAMESLFWWEGSVQSENECAFIAKTVPERMDELIREVRAAHSYDLPCIVALDLVAGDEEFLAWIREETAAGRA